MSITARIDAISHIPLVAQSEAPPVPRSVKIELSGRCNYRCTYCALTVRARQPARDMDWTLFTRITAEMRALGVEEIGLFFIGESFMAPALLTRAIRYLKHDLVMPYVFLTSNASLASPIHVDRVMEAGLDSLKWSVNAADEEQFVSLMHVAPKLYGRARMNIQSAWAIRQAKGYSTKLYASSIRYDGAQHAAMQVMLATEILPYVDQHYWLPLYSMGSLTTAAEAAVGYRPSAGNIGRFDAPVDPLPCWSAFTEGHVLADGRLSACCFDATGSWIMGDLTTQSFLGAWHSPAFRALRRAHLARTVAGTICERCIAAQADPLARAEGL